MKGVEFLEARYPEHSVVLRRRWLAASASADPAGGERE